MKKMEDILTDSESAGLETIYVTYNPAERELLKSIDDFVLDIGKANPPLKISNDILRAVYVDHEIKNKSSEIDRLNKCLHVILEWDPVVYSEKDADIFLEVVLFKPIKDFLLKKGYSFEDFQYLGKEDGSAIMIFLS
ncbi:MAG: hypothetical protein K2Q26_03910 [Bdellovibrionales bacterium]|nr:hypothetical protein [Bdellovibrionales bacterium]